jgi:serine/threonine protein kinase
LAHRDLKPRNVLLAADGPRVIDFGIARALDSKDHQTQTGAVIGTPGYIAPDQAFGGQVGTAADVFAWGTLIAHAATGHNPFGTGTTHALAVRAEQAEYDLSGVPRDLLPMVQAALDPAPARRPTAESLLVRLLGQQHLEEAATQLIHTEWRSVPTSPATAPQHPSGAVSAASRAVAPPRGPSKTQPPRPSRRWTWVLAGVIALFVLAATNAGVYAFAHNSFKQRPQKPSAAASTPIAPPSPVRQWHVIGGLDRLTDYCEYLGYRSKVVYTEQGRRWWCLDVRERQRSIDLYKACKWHYPDQEPIRVAERRPTGRPGEVVWDCQVLA